MELHLGPIVEEYATESRITDLERIIQFLSTHIGLAEDGVKSLDRVMIVTCSLWRNSLRENYNRFLENPEDFIDFREEQRR